MANKFNLIVLVLGRQSLLLDSSRNNFIDFKKQYALDNTTLVVIFLGEKANRIISGQPICGIDIFPNFDDSEGKQDVAINIQGWLYEAQSNIKSDNMVKIKTAIFVDVCDDLIEKHNINPADILGSLEEIKYFCINRHTKNYELVKVSQFSKIESLAKTGDKKALYDLGIAYATGDCVEKDNPQAQIMLFKSYLRGNIEAIFALVDMFDEPSEHFCELAAKHGNLRAMDILKNLNGKQSEQYKTKADSMLKNSNGSFAASKIPIIRTYEDFKTLKEKAESGDSESQCFLADIYADKSREFFNEKEAFLWYKKAAEFHTRAQWLLGACYFQGIGTEKDMDKAEYWLGKSASSENADGQYALAGYYFMNPKRDIAAAKHWIDKAIEQGHAEAKLMLEVINKGYEI
jgi:TPR repeat protein